MTDRYGRFVGTGDELKIAQCNFCKHYEGYAKCKAFGEKRIPKDILLNRHDHKEPYPGDNGILFELREDLDESWWRDYQGS